MLTLATPCHSEILAWDNADLNDPYQTENTFRPGQNGGDGFTSWVSLDTTPPTAHGGRFLVHPGLEGNSSWGMQGTYAMGRGLQTALTAGSWTFLASHEISNPANSGFSGFTLKSVSSGNNYPLTQGELLRFGFNRHDASDEGGGILVSTDGGVHYQYHPCGWTDGDGDLLEYTVTWNGSGVYALQVKNLTEGLTTSFVGAMTAGPVAMLGFAIYGGTNSETITFDVLQVVPEPTATLPALLLVAAAVFARRTNRRRGT